MTVDKQPRPLTTEEMRKLFLGQLQAYVEYWARPDLEECPLHANPDIAPGSPVEWTMHCGAVRLGIVAKIDADGRVFVDAQETNVRGKLVTRTVRCWFDAKEVHRLRAPTQAAATALTEGANKAKGIRERLEGLLHSVLVTLDGGSGGCPAMSVIPQPHPTDEAFCRENGENWWVAIAIADDVLLHDERRKPY